MDPKCPYFGQPKYDCKINAFSDGSLFEKARQSGAAIYINQGDYKYSYKLGPNVGIWQAEVFAAKKFAQWVIKNKPVVAGLDCCLYIDSQSCIKALDSKTTRSKLVARTIDLLNGAARQCGSLTIRWCRSHSGILSNENCDFLAKAGAKSDGPVVQDAPLPSIATVKLDLRKRVDDFWTFHWQRQTQFRQTREFFPEISKKRSFELVNTKRTLYSRLVQVYTGHCFLNRHQFLVHGAEDEAYDPACDLCDYNYSQTSAHVIYECPYFLGLRAQLLGTYIEDPPYVFPQSKVVRFLRESGIMALQWDDIEVQNSNSQ